MMRSVGVVLILVSFAFDAMGDEPDRRFPLFQYLTGQPAATMVTYTPSQLDPRQEVIILPCIILIDRILQNDGLAE